MTRIFNTIETIRTNAELVINGSRFTAFLAACDAFEKEAAQFSTNKSFFAKNAANEVSLAYEKAKHADCEYSCYVAANACEKWFEQTLKYAL